MKNGIIKHKKIRKLKPHEDCDFKTETYQCIKIEVQEQHYDLDKELEKDDSIFRYEFNLIELPIFSKNDKVKNGISKKYVFSEKDNSYIAIIPSNSPFARSNKILQEFDETIFYAIMRLSRIQKSKNVITDYFTLIEIAKLRYDGKQLDRTKDSIERMKNNLIEISHAFYDAKAGKGRINKNINLLQSVQIITFEEYQELPKEKQKEYESYFRNSKIKEILILTISDEIFQNIENKGYLNFDAEKLLRIDNAVARKLFVLLMKWQGWEKKTNIIRSCRFIASRIPLSFENKNIGWTIKTIERSCCNLKKLSLIKEFNFIRTKPLTNSSIEFELFTTHDHDLLDDNKQKLICMTNQFLAIETGHERLQIQNEDEFIELTEKVIKQETIDIKPSNISITSKEPSQLTFDSIYETDPSKELSNLFNLLPPDHRKQETIRAIIYKCSKRMGLDYVRRNIEYSNKNSKTNYRAYLVEALKNDYGLGLQEDKKQERKVTVKIEEGMLIELHGKQFKIEPGICIHPDGYDGGCMPEGEIRRGINEGWIRIPNLQSAKINSAPK